MTALHEYVASRELLQNLTLRELRTRYKRSVLGWTWSLLNPLANVLIYTLVFSYFLKVVPPVGSPSGLQSFALFLLCGLIPWNFFSGGLTSGLSSLLANSNLIRKVYFPRELLVASTIGSLIVTMLIELGVLSAILLILGSMMLPWLPVVLLLVAIEAVFVFGIALVLAVWNVYFRDVQYLVFILLQVVFYMCPIVYPIRYVPVHATVLGVEIPLLRLYTLNPLVRFVAAFRSALYDLRFPRFGDLAYVTVWAVAMLAVGLWVFSRLDRRLAEEV